MKLSSFPGMFRSDETGWLELVRIHPSVAKLTVFFVAPLSLLPPAMFAWTALEYPGKFLPLMEPPMGGAEALLVAGIFFLAELAVVPLMAVIIQQTGDVVDFRPDYEAAYTLAAVAPAPLWLASLALFIPNLWADLFILALAWVGSAALIRHGVHPLFQLEDARKARVLANFTITAGVLAWLALMVVETLLVSMVMQWR